MTDLVQDAICTAKPSTSITNIANRVNPIILKEMLDDLDKREIISLVFLTIDKNTDFYKVLEEVKKDPCYAFTRLPSMNAYWAEKLIESLIIIGNKYVIRKLGFDKNEIQYLENSFVTRQHNISPYLNKAIKSLYFLCENLDNNETKKLIEVVNEKLGKSSDVNLDNMYLELHILEWLQHKYISIDPDKFDLSNLLKNLKTIGCLVNLPFNFDDWEMCDPVVNRNEQDSQICSQTPDNISSLQYQNSDHNISNTDADIMWSSPDHLKLLIIVNEIDFTDVLKFKSRKKGSMEDERNLEKTFKGCGFEIEKHRNLDKQSMMELLESLNSTSYSKYGAIFICILSHGFKGEVVFVDDNCISIDTITEKFCCRRLQNVFKFLILQSCRGEKIGLVDKQCGKLVQDGPSNSVNLRYRLHFCIFHATVQDFVAIRDEGRGSWFIQDLCQQIQEVDKQIEINNLIKKVKLAVTNRRGRLADHYLDAIQVPEVSGDTTIHPYVLIRVTENRRLENNI